MDPENKNQQIRERLKIRVDLVQVVMKRKLNLFGHLISMDGSRKKRSVMMGMMEGNQRRGRPCRQWLDDIGLYNKDAGLQSLNLLCSTKCHPTFPDLRKRPI